MKPKLWNFLTVCLLTLVVLAPALLVISVVWQEHLNFVATQQLTNHGEKTIFYVLLSLMFSAPIGFWLGIYLHHRYVVYRAAMRQRQIEMLERIWHSGTYRQAKLPIQNEEIQRS